MSAAPRRLLGRAATLASREEIYEVADGLEVESREHYDVTRKRVLWQDVLLVTYHREIGVAFVIINALAAALFISLGVLITKGGAGASVAAMIFLIIGLPFFFAAVIRLVYRVDVVTVFGRRSKAAIRFVVRKQRARELYGQICAKARAAQRTIAAEIAETAPPVVEEIPLPPPLDASA